MNYRLLNKTDLEISSITLGTWVFDGAMWSGSKEEDCIEAVHAAIDHGVNVIDTAPIYGNGLSETIVGKAIAGKRDNLVIATKCGLIQDGKMIDINLRPKSIIKECEDSLKRLNIDRIDIYQCHWPDMHTPIEDTFGTFKQLQQEGKIRYIGLSNYNADQIKEASAFGDIVTAQSQYSMLEREVEKGLLSFLNEEAIGLLAYGSLAGGILTGKYIEPPKFPKSDARNFFYKYYEGENFKLVTNLLNELRKLKHPANEIAVNWVRQQKGVGSVLVGCRNREQVERNIKAVGWQLSDEEINTINDLLGVYANA